jgi:putative endonuclease
VIGRQLRSDNRTPFAPNQSVVIPTGARDPHKCASGAQARKRINQLAWSPSLRLGPPAPGNEGLLSRVVLHTGVTNSLELAFGFTRRYHVDRLVYDKRFDCARDAISREKEIKDWRREKKNDLVRKLNPKWEDLGQKLFWDRR